jgi:hypothetical protein
MYDEPPDPEPNPCPFCDAELGHGDGCDHCAMARKLGEAEGALSTLRHRLHCRARNLAWLPPTADVAARRAEGVALLLELAGLPLPPDYLAQARAAMVGEYGDSRPYRPGGLHRLAEPVPDADIVARFMEWAHAETLAASPATFTAEMLNAKPATHGDQLWWGDDANGVPRIYSQAEKLRGVAGGAGTTQWGLTLRETIDKALDSEARGAAHWLEFYRDYLSPPASLIPPEDPRYVRGGEQPKVSFVVGIEAYTAYVGKHKDERWKSQGLGFGGAEFMVRLADGREFFTDNNWGCGEVPPHLRKLLRSNAVFLTRPPRAPVAAESATA